MGRREILLAGAGGQGILFFGSILSLAAALKGNRVLSNPTYGAAVRGGEVTCGVIISDEEIHDPVVEDADVVVTLNEASLERFGSRVKEEGVLICEESEKIAAIVDTLKKPFRVISIPFRDLGPDRYHNMIAMGVLLQIMTDLDMGVARQALEKEMKKKGREGLIEENLRAIKSGTDWYLKDERKQIEER